MSDTSLENRIWAGMVGLGMIFDETYRPLFEQLHAEGLYRRDFGPVAVELTAVASRTGKRAEEYRHRAANRIGPFVSCVEPDAVGQLLRQPVTAGRSTF
jgi:D-galacturonate reductase